MAVAFACGCWGIILFFIGAICIQNEDNNLCGGNSEAVAMVGFGTILFVCCWIGIVKSLNNPYN